MNTSVDSHLRANVKIVKTSPIVIIANYFHDIYGKKKRSKNDQPTSMDCEKKESRRMPKINDSSSTSERGREYGARERKPWSGKARETGANME